MLEVARGRKARPVGLPRSSLDKTEEEKGHHYKTHTVSEKEREGEREREGQKIEKVKKRE